jgi:hypothetical protein
MAAQQTSKTDDGRLDKLENHAVRTEDRLNNIERTQEAHGGKLDGIGTTLQTLTTQLVRYDSRPQFDASRIISTARDVFAILAVCGAFGVWYVTTLAGARSDLLTLEIRHQAEKISWLESRFNWTAQLESKPK